MSRILVVDDEEEIREMLARHFRLLDHDVAVSANGAEALEHLARNKVDIVISDIRMPVLDGIGLLRAMRDQYPMVRVIMTTGYVNLESALACMRNRAETVVFKPFTDLGELELAVDRAREWLDRWQRKLSELRVMA